MRILNTVPLLALCLFGTSTLLAQGTTAPPPACETDPRYAEFDFWLGTWDVYSVGNKVGVNTITREESGCLVLEKWVDVNGGTGQSYNYFNPDTEQWRQVWVSSFMAIDYVGGLTDDGAMELTGEVTYFHNAQSAKFFGRWTPRDDGTVEQHFEHYDSEKGEMVPIFTAIYQRQE